MHHSLSLLVYHLHIWCSFEIVPQFLDILFLDCFFFSFFLLEFQFGKFFLNYLQVHQCLGSLALADEPMEIALISLTVLFLALVLFILRVSNSLLPLLICFCMLSAFSPVHISRVIIVL